MTRLAAWGCSSPQQSIRGVTCSAASLRGMPHPTSISRKLVAATGAASTARYREAASHPRQSCLLPPDPAATAVPLRFSGSAQVHTPTTPRFATPRFRYNAVVVLDWLGAAWPVAAPRPFVRSVPPATPATPAGWLGSASSAGSAGSAMIDVVCSAELAGVVVGVRGGGHCGGAAKAVRRRPSAGPARPRRCSTCSKLLARAAREFAILYSHLAKFPSRNLILEAFPWRALAAGPSSEPGNQQVHAEHAMEGPALLSLARQAKLMVSRCALDAAAMRYTPREARQGVATAAGCGVASGSQRRPLQKRRDATPVTWRYPRRRCQDSTPD